MMFACAGPSHPGKGLRAAALALALGATFAACGLRTPPRPPEDTAPVIPGVVSAEREGKLVVVRWKRAERSADAMRLDDLAAFVVDRKRDGEQQWQRVGTVDVVDQEKIRRRREFAWRDAEAGSAAVSYRVRAVCADGQEGPPAEATAVERTD